MHNHTLSCGELGNPVCDYMATGGSDEDVKRKMMAHVEKAHPEKVKTPGDRDALGRKIDQVLEKKAGEETHGARGRYGIEEEEDESQGGEFLDSESSRGYRDPSEERRDADRDAEEHRTGANLR